MGDDFAVGVGCEYRAFRCQARAQLFIVFDNAVVHHGNEIAAQMRVRVTFAGHAVSSPTCMCNADVTAGSSASRS